MAARVRIIPAGLQALRTDGMLPFITRIAEEAATGARRLVNVDTGTLRSRIRTAIDVDPGGDVVGWVFADTSYAIWQEFEPGEDIPGIGTRRRRGGKPYLRPAVQEAIQRNTRR